MAGVLRLNMLDIMTGEMYAAQETQAYAKLRIERTNARLVGVRAKKAKEAAKEAEAAA
jgi:hypothetical protein